MKNIEITYFSSKILFTDETTFSRDSIKNSHNWAEQNLHTTFLNFTNNSLAEMFHVGIINDRLIRPHILPPRLDGDIYMHFLEQILPELLDGVLLATRMNM